YIQVTRTCNQACIFCSNPELDRETTLAQACALVDDLAARGYDGVILTGGEPTLFCGLAELIAHATGRGLGVRIITNGQKTCDPAYLQGLHDAGLRHVHQSVYTDDPEIQGRLTGRPESHRNLCASLDNVGALGIRVDVNITIQKHNADHLDRVVRWLTGRWPFVGHVVFNNLDPTSDRVASHPEVVHHLADMEPFLFRALAFLEAEGRSFRVERVPLCYMAEFAHTSTETRKIVKGEERIVHFLDQKGMVRQTDWQHGKTDVCSLCSLTSICAGLFAMDTFYSSRELYPLFVPKEPIVRRILQDR
ncbi:MAG: radical SAM protein, partial [Deltaproteobacteria bacterium]|nr:radical SAM protein [Deltaproteobacteria bacterium]